MKHYYIEEYKNYPAVTLYTIRMQMKKLSETDDFIDRFQHSVRYAEDFQTIIYFLQKISENGSLERYLRPEGKASAIPIISNKLRLYCIRLSDQILILGNGNSKTAKKIQDCSNCFPHFDLANQVSKTIGMSIRNKQTFINGQKLTGQLTFPLN